MHGGVSGGGGGGAYKKDPLEVSVKAFKNITTTALHVRIYASNRLQLAM